MYHSPAEVIRWLLVALELGTDPADGAAWPVYATNEPNEPDNCITVYDTTGISDGRSMMDGALWQHHGFQVRVRAKDHHAGWVKADAIRTAMAEQACQRTVSRDGKRYLVWSINKIGLVLVLGIDNPTSKRQLFTVNAVAPIKAY